MTAALDGDRDAELHRALDAVVDIARDRYATLTSARSGGPGVIELGGEPLRQGGDPARPRRARPGRPPRPRPDRGDRARGRLRGRPHRRRQRVVIATDTMKNTAYAFATDHLTARSRPTAARSPSTSSAIPQVDVATVNVREHHWRAIDVAGTPAPDAFVRGGEGTRVATRQRVARRRVVVEAGVEDLDRDEDDALVVHGLPARPVHDAARDRRPADGDQADRDLALRLARPRLRRDVRWPSATTLLEVFADHDSPSVQTSIWIMATAILERHEEVEEVRMVLPEPPPLAGRPVAVRARERPRGLHRRRPSRTGSSRRPCAAGRADDVERAARRRAAARAGPRRRPDPDPRRARVRRRPPAPVRSAAARPPRAPPGAPGRARRRRAAGLPAWRPGEIRDADWTVAPAPADLDDRRVEITGPAEPKMMINALNSGARVFMADLEDALSPTWANVVGGQAALVDAVRGTLAFDSPEGKAYRLERRDRHARRPAARLAPRRVGTCWSTACRSRPACSTSGCTCSTTAPSRSRRGSGPYLYLRQARVAPRGAALERGLRPRPGGARDPARLDPGDGPDRDDPRRVRDGRDPVRAARARRRAQRRPLGLPVQRHQEVPRRGPDLAVPDRAQLTMTVPFMRAYTELLVRTCHRRGAHAIGGMAAFIPNRRDPAVTEAAMAQGPRRQGARVAATGSTARGSPIPTSCRSRRRSSIASSATRPNQKDRLREEVSVGAAELLDLRVPDGGRHRGRGPGQRPGRAGLPRLVAARHRRGRDRQPDGGRRDGRDLALAALAVADPRRRARRRPGRSTRTSTRRSATRSWPARRGRGRAAWRRRPSSSTGSSSTTTSPSS